MKRFDLWKLSWLNVLSTPVRSLLTVLGFAVGIAAVLAVFTLGDAGKVQVMGEMKRLGIDRVWVSTGEADTMDVFTGQRIEKMTGAHTEMLAYAPLTVESTVGEQMSVKAVGCEWSYLKQLHFADLVCTQQAWNEQLQPVIAGSKIAQSLGVSIGDTLFAECYAFRIVGIADSAQSVTTLPIEETLFFPLNALLAQNGGTIQEIQVMSEEKIPVEKLEKLTKSTLEFNGIKADVTSMSMQLEAANSVVDTFVNVLLWVALVCVLAGGIGVMNILLVGIRERRREIGIMKSLGTTTLTICGLFMLEAMIYAAAGGCCGVALGSVLIRIAGESMDLDARISLIDCITVLLCALAGGMLFGVVPAWKASRLSCVDALRQE